MGSEELLIDPFVEAYEQGFIVEAFEDEDFECSNDKVCSECPAKHQCAGLSDSGNYTTYIENFHKYNIGYNLVKAIDDLN